MTEDLLSPCDEIFVITDIEATVKRAVDLVATREIELEGTVVDVDEVWGREKEKVEVFVLCGCSCKYGPDERPRHSLFSATQCAEMRNK